MKHTPTSQNTPQTHTHIKKQRHGVKESALGSTYQGTRIPPWLEKWTSLILQWTELELRLLPEELVKPNPRQPLYEPYTRRGAEIEAAGVALNRLSNVVITLDKIKYCLRNGGMLGVMVCTWTGVYYHVKCKLNVHNVHVLCMYMCCFYTPYAHTLCTHTTSPTPSTHPPTPSTHTQAQISAPSVVSMTPPAFTCCGTPPTPLPSVSSLLQQVHWPKTE